MLSEEDFGQLLPLITAAARAAVQESSTRTAQYVPATVTEGGEVGATVVVTPDQPTIDGADQYSIDVQNLTGAYLAPGMRVMVMFDPSQGARASFVIGGASGFVPGDMIFASTSTKPAPWIFADGRSFDATANPILAGIFPSLTVPDLRGRSLVGISTGASGLTRVTAANGLGVIVGTERHTLTLSEMPSHTHPLYQGSGYAVGGTAIAAYPNSAGSGGGVTLSAGSGNSHNNTHPAVAFWPFIFGG